MTKSKHTPGPWYLSKGKTYVRKEYPIKIHGYPGDFNICEVTSSVGNPAFEANARLIAAAPDMLEALENRTAILCEKSCNADAGFHTGACEQANAAIAKAKRKA